MNERILRRDLLTGEATTIALDEAISELSVTLNGLYSEIGPRLRGGECLRLPDGRSYCAMAALEVDGTLPLPPNLVN